MKKGKKFLALMLSTVLVLTFVKLNLFADGAGAGPELGSYYEVNDDGTIKYDTKTENPEKIINNEASDAYIKMSKTAEQPDDAENDEFEITLKVETTENLQELTIKKNTSVVLVIDVSDSMDRTMSGTYPNGTGWKLANTRWTALKKAAKQFIEKLFEDGNTGNQVSIVAYGGSVEGKIEPIVHRTICNWTNDPDAAINTFYKYDMISQDSIGMIPNGGGRNLTCLRKDLFDDNTYVYANTNCQAGFIGATDMLRDGNCNSDNSQYVLYLSDGIANVSYINEGWVKNGSPAKDYVKYEDDAIAEAKNLKAAFPSCKLYTVGFSTDAKSSRVLSDKVNTNVDKYFHADEADELFYLYETINTQIHIYSQAFTVTDPMSDFVILDEASISNPNSAFSVADGTITWDLHNETFFETYTDTGGNTVYVYTLTYKVKVDATADDGTWHPMNKRTTLAYAFSDEKGYLKEAAIADFYVPTYKLYPIGSIAKTSSVSQVGPGDTYTYTITASNADSAEGVWKNVVATDVLDSSIAYSGHTIEAGDDVSVSVSGATVTIGFGDLYPGDIKIVKIEVKVNSDAAIGSYINNTVIASSDNDDKKEAEDPDPPIIRSIGSIIKTSSVSQVRLGETYTYTITASNPENAEGIWENVVAADILDGSIAFNGYTIEEGDNVSVSVAGSTVTISFGNIIPGDRKIVKIEVKVNSDAVIGDYIYNAVIASSDNEDDIKAEDPDPPVIVGAGGSITKISSESQVRPGDNYYYTITASNSSYASEAWKNVVAEDELPDSVSYVDYEALSSGVIVTESGGTVRIEFGDIGIDESKGGLFNGKEKNNVKVEGRIIN